MFSCFEKKCNPSEDFDNNILQTHSDLRRPFLEFYKIFSDDSTTITPQESLSDCLSHLSTCQIVQHALFTMNLKI